LSPFFYIYSWLRDGWDYATSLYTTWITMATVSYGRKLVTA
jgi:hypothetical protein